MVSLLKIRHTLFLVIYSTCGLIATAMGSEMNAILNILLSQSTSHGPVLPAFPFAPDDVPVCQTKSHKTLEDIKISLDQLNHANGFASELKF